jgi:hemolysin activation/secretion protein
LIRVDEPLIRLPDHKLLAGLLLERRQSQTFLFNQPFVLNPGADPTGKSVSAALRVELSWLKRDPQNVLAAESLLSVGIDALDATINTSGPDSHFVTWLGQFQWLHQFSQSDFQLVTRADTQIANRPLLVVEKFPIGGALSVRGYRESLLVTDQGFASSVEARYPVFKNPDGARILQAAVFTDYGVGQNKHDRSSRTEISSVGVGFIFMPRPELKADIYCAKGLNDTGQDYAEHDLQDSGIYFSITYDFL